MLTAFVLFIICGLGFEAKSLGWRPFAVLAGLAIPAVALKILTTAQGLKALGESADALYDPISIVVSCIFQWLIWSSAYLIGFAIGNWRRKKKSNINQDKGQTCETAAKLRLDH